jgi:AcrR family transcriptional regulator
MVKPANSVIFPDSMSTVKDDMSHSERACRSAVVMYTEAMPKLWNETIATHRREVRDAILDATAKLVAEQGLRAVTMSQIAEETGIGRATLYKYFSGVEPILVAWHERQITDHLEQFTALGGQAGNPGERLEAVLRAYALMISHQQHGTEIAALLHRGEHVAKAHGQLNNLVRDLLAAAAEGDGEVRNDVPPDELASFCLHALSAASTLTGKAAVNRLVSVTLSGLRARS